MGGGGGGPRAGLGTLFTVHSCRPIPLAKRMTHAPAAFPLSPFSALSAPPNAASAGLLPPQQPLDTLAAGGGTAAAAGGVPAAPGSQPCGGVGASWARARRTAGSHQPSGSALQHAAAGAAGHPSGAATLLPGAGAADGFYAFPASRDVPPGQHLRPARCGARGGTDRQAGRQAVEGGCREAAGCSFHTSMQPGV